MTAQAKSVPSRRHGKQARKASRVKTLLLRLRPTDSPHGVSAHTLKELAVILGVPETQVIHAALRRLADEFIPAYEPDDGPVSDRMLAAIKAQIPQGEYKSVASSLF